jgi:IS5 family transposase
LGFEPLCREVADSISWQRFCRIPLGTGAPHPTTLMKITTRCGVEAVNGLNEALLAKAVAAKVLKTNRLRADPTVIEANVAYPTDSGLLAKGVAGMAKLVKRLKGEGLAARTASRDRTRTVNSRARDMAANLRKRTEDAKDAVKAINLELAVIAQRAITEAQAVVRNASRKLGKEGSARCRAWIEELERMAQMVQIVADQTRMRMAGTMPDGASRLVSLHDADARAIRKGRLGKPVEFGYKAQVVDNEDGVVVDHNVEIGNPADAPMLSPAIKRVSRLTGRAPRAVTADRGYAELSVERDLKQLGVTTVALPSRGRPTATCQQLRKRRSFQKLVKWRTGCEGRISCLKRDFGWARTRMDGIDGARTWCGHGVFSHNLVKIALLVR